MCSSLLTRPTYSGSLLPGSTPYKLAWWPPPGSGSLHQHESCPDRFQNAVEALVDLFLLAQVRRLIFSGGFFGMGARYIAGSTATPERYPKRIHPTFEEKSD